MERLSSHALMWKLENRRDELAMANNNTPRATLTINLVSLQTAPPSSGMRTASWASKPGISLAPPTISNPPSPSPRRQKRGPRHTARERERTVWPVRGVEGRSEQRRKRSSVGCPAQNGGRREGVRPFGVACGERIGGKERRLMIQSESLYLYSP